MLPLEQAAIYISSHANDANSWEKVSDSISDTISMAANRRIAKQYYCDLRKNR